MCIRDSACSLLCNPLKVSSRRSFSTWIAIVPPPDSIGTTLARATILRVPDPDLAASVPSPVGIVQLEREAAPVGAHSRERFLPAPEAAQCISSFDIARPDGDRGRECALGVEIAQERGQQPGNGRVSRSGGAGDIDLEARSPELPAGPGGGV